MPKVLTTKRLAGEADKARAYIRTHILLPSGVLGLIFMIAGMGSLAYQFLAESYNWYTFVASTGLFMGGGLLGWALTRYHRYILQNFPEYYAGKMKTHNKSRRHKAQREKDSPVLHHPWRGWVPVGYVLGMLFLPSLSALAVQYGSVFYWAAFLLPWSGFFWAKLFFWRGILSET